VLPLHGKLSPEEQSAVFEISPNGKRKIVFSTNVAETSVTIPGIIYVIDSGMVKEKFYDAKKNMSILEKKFINQSSANQRKGRAGRTAPGVVHRLYSEDDFNLMEEFKLPEISRIHLDEVILKLIQMGIKDFLEFNFIEKPPQGALEKALETLVNHGAVDKKSMKMTEFGKLVLDLSLPTETTKFLFEGMKNGVFKEVLIIVSMLSVSNSVFWRGNASTEQEALEKKFSFCHERGDFFTYLNVFNAFFKNSKNQSKWCAKNFINKKAMSLCQNKMKEINRIWKNNKFIEKIPKRIFQTEETVESKIIRAATSAFFSNLCYSNGQKNGYNILSLDINAIIHPASSLYISSKDSKILLYHQFSKTSQFFIRDLIETDKSFVIEEVSKEFLEKIKLEEKEIHELKISDLGNLIISKLRTENEIKALEKQYQCVLNISSNSISTWISKKKQNTLEASLKKIIDTTKSELEKESFKFNIQEYGIQAIVQGGGMVSDILLNDEFDVISLSKLPKNISKKEIANLFTKFGQIRKIELFESSKHSWGYIHFESKESAKKALNQMDGYHFNNETISVQIKKDSEEMIESVLTKSIDVRWFSGVSSNPVFIKFSSSQNSSAQYAAGNFGCVLDKKNENSVIIFKPTMDEIEYRKLFSRFGLIESISSNRAEEKIEDQDLLIFYKELYTLFEQFGAISQFIEIPMNAKEGRKQNPLKIVRIDYEEIESVKRATQSEKQIFHDKILHVNADTRYELKISNEMAKFLKKPMNDCFSEIRKKYGNNIQIKENTGRLNTTIIIKATYYSKEVLKAANNQLSSIFKFQSVSFPFEFVDSILSKDGEKDLYEIQKKFSVYISREKFATILRVYGNKNNVDDAIKDLNSYLQTLKHKFHKRMKVKKGSFKKIFGDLNLKTIKEKYQLQDFHFELTKNEITLVGSQDSVFKVVNLINETLLLIKNDQITDECDVCMDDIDNGYKLLLCGHKFCKECIIHKINSSISNFSTEYPIKCPLCPEIILVKDLENLLSSESMDQVCSAGFRKYQTQHDEYSFCITESCSFFKVPSNFFHDCPKCGKSFCVKCKKLPHSGLTCKEANDNDFLFERYKLEAGIKKCPKCQKDIEKNMGCNHMSCIMCKHEFCWICMANWQSSHYQCPQ
jgi:ATP-dependent RNA helicase DHX8/PRP22